MLDAKSNGRGLNAMRHSKEEKRKLKAPPGKFRVIGDDLRDGHSFMVGDFDALETAEQRAKERGGVGTPTHVYNDRGELVVRYGSRQ
jgi:hypothetical protein